jgi:cell division initiation protein
MRDLTTEEIRGRKFKTRFRGYDKKIIQEFLDELADELDRLAAENRALQTQVAEKTRGLEQALDQNRKLTDGMEAVRNSSLATEERAKKQADLIISKAELTAEKILNNAHQRVAQLHDDLAELKRQRTHFEVKLRSFIEAQLKFLDMEKENHQATDELDGKVRFISKT